MKHSSLTRFGFTLVEMLTVIAIIGILAALMSGAMVAVRARVQKAAISAELKQLEMALEAYKTTYGEYPPDGTDATAVKRHLAKAYPRATGLNVTGINPGNALVFWLGGPIKDGRTVGFSKDPKNPDVTGSNTTTPRSAPLYDFNPAQFGTVSGNFATYTSKTGGSPYVYFRAKVSGGTTSYTGTFNDNGASITPYKKGSVWYGEKRFQIISPGLDGKYGVGGDVNAAIKNADAFDNQTNFGDIEDLAD
jgi:prepilin-type N-terminal cleavage/methylation domain-containing protein